MGVFLLLQHNCGFQFTKVSVLTQQKNSLVTFWAILEKETKCFFTFSL